MLKIASTWLFLFGLRVVGLNSFYLGALPVKFTPSILKRQIFNLSTIVWPLCGRCLCLRQNNKRRSAEIVCARFGWGTWNNTRVNKLLWILALDTRSGTHREHGDACGRCTWLENSKPGLFRSWRVWSALAVGTMCVVGISHIFEEFFLIDSYWLNVSLSFF